MGKLETAPWFLWPRMSSITFGDAGRFLLLGVRGAQQKLTPRFPSYATT